MEFKAGEEAGWHVILGSNGSGKSSLVRSFALVLMGEKEAYAARQEFDTWVRSDSLTATIEVNVTGDREFDILTGGGNWPSRAINGQVTILVSPDRNRTDLKFTGSGMQRTIWGGGAGWFSASFGPFRRFSGGDSKYDRLFVSNKRLAPHLTALGEDVALTDAMEWLSNLFVRAIREDAASGPSGVVQTLMREVVNFINNTGFFPQNEAISLLANDFVHVADANGFSIPFDQLSDGYRSALSFVLELLRQMVELYGIDTMLTALTKHPGTVHAPGVVMIDEVDTHLHPTWQRDIGKWLTKCFPLVQFIVTTHSPIVCRAVAAPDGTIKGSIWKLPALGAEDNFRRVDELELEKLIFGDVLDAYSTELFGVNVIRSSEGEQKLVRLAELNLKALEGPLNAAEESERNHLRAAFPTGTIGLESD